MSFRESGMIAIDLTGIDRVPIRFRSAPHSDVMCLTLDALGLVDLGGSVGQRADIRNALRAGRGGLPALFHPAISGWWEGLVPVTEPNHAAYRGFGAIVRDGVAFREAVTQEYGARPPGSLARIMARPDGFFDSYIEDCTAVWRAFRPRIGDLQLILDREAEQVGSAVVRGVLPELLTTVVPVATLRGSTLVIPYTSRWATLTIAPDGLTVGASLHGLRWVTLGVKPGTTQLNSIWYPAQVRPGRPRPGADVDPLTSLLGEPRTLLLRHLDVACSAGELASRLNTGPSGITYHVDALVASGLVERQRDGRHVIVNRTRRGDGLLDLYGG